MSIKTINDRYHDPRHPSDSDLPDNIERLRPDGFLERPNSPRVREFLGRYKDDTPVIPLPAETEKACGACRVVKPLDKFRMYLHSNGRRYEHSICKQCESEMAIARAKKANSHKKVAKRK